MIDLWRPSFGRIRGKFVKGLKSPFSGTRTKANGIPIFILAFLFVVAMSIL